MSYRLVKIAASDTDRCAIVDDDGRRVSEHADLGAGTRALAALTAGTRDDADKKPRGRRRPAETPAPVVAEFADPEDDDHPPFLDGQ